MENQGYLQKIQLTEEEKIEIGLQVGMNKSLKKIVFGFLWFIIGVAIFIATLLSISPVIFIMWGAIAFGFIDIIRGGIGYFLTKRKYNKFCLEKGSISNYDEYKIKKIDYNTVYIFDKEKLFRQRKILKFVSIIIIVFIVGSTLFLVSSFALTNIEKEKFVGSWSVVDSQSSYIDFGNNIEFKSNGRISCDGEGFLFNKWEIKNGEFYLEFDFLSDTTYYSNFDYIFSDDETHVVLTDCEMPSEKVTLVKI